MFNSSVRSLNGISSIFLDILRLVCSVTVLIVHSQAVWLPERENNLLPSHISHGAVIVFFVLSGYVIAHTTSVNRRNSSEYLIARLTRLYSIFFPAIIVTAICALLANWLNQKVYLPYDRGNNIPRYLISLFYCNELWFLSSAPLINGPIWSLGYEFWYYIIFGAFFYKTRGWKGWLLPITLTAIAGPKILLMMLIWIMGWFAYHAKKAIISVSTSWTLVSILLVISVILMIYLPSLPFELNHPPLLWAGQFVTDWIVGFFVSTAIWLLPTNTERSISDSKNIKNVRAIANMTFPIYVMHLPLIVLFKCMFSPYIDRVLGCIISATLTMVVSIALGFLFEANKNKWKSFFQFAFNKSKTSRFIPSFK